MSKILPNISSNIIARCLHPFLRSCLSITSGALIVILLLATPGFSLAIASESGRVEGNVVDPSGSKIADARVVLRDRTGQIAYQTRANDEGRFAFSNVAAGDYGLLAEVAGFSQPEKITVSVGAGQTQNVEVRLDVAAISDKIVVSATRTAALTDELGGAVTVIGGEDLRLANQTLVSESLRMVPGLIVAQSGGRGDITSIFARGGESDYNKVLIDGVPVNSAGGAFDFASLTPENVESLEVVRGPRSALFGSDAMTSVIQLFTARGSTRVPELEMSGEGGSFAFHRETARLSGLAGWFDYSASFGFQHTDGRFQNSDYTNRSASVNLGFRLSPDAELRVTTRLNNNTLGVSGPTAILFADPDQRQKHRDIATSATLDLKTTSRWHNTARFIYSEFEGFSFDPVAQDLTLPNTPPSSSFFGPDFAFTFHDHEKRAGIHYQTIAALGGSNVLTGGIDFEHESAVFTDDFSRVTPDRNNLGFYVQDQAAWHSRLFVTAGIRVERNTGSVPEDFRAALASIDSSAPVGEVGFGVTANPNVAVSVLARAPGEDEVFGATRFKASFGTGIKEPRLDEAFSPSIFFLGNPGLDPERTTSFDLGASQEFFGRRASVELTYFDNRFRDVIDFVFDPVTFGPVRLADGRLTNFINIERASARGIELIAAARPLLRLRVQGSYTYLRTRLERAADALSPEQGLPLTRRPRHSGTFEISWTDQRFDITFDGSLVGNRRDVDPISGARFDLSGRPIFNDGYAKLNGAGAYNLTRSVAVFARVENLLNDDYQEILGFPAYRLNFSAGLRVRIGGKN